MAQMLLYISTRKEEDVYKRQLIGFMPVGEGDFSVDDPVEI